MKEYLLKLLELCSDENFGQQAIEYAILNGHLKLTCDLQTDLRAILGEPNRPETGQYDQLCAAYRAITRQHTEILVGLYESSGLMAAITGVPEGVPADWQGQLATVCRAEEGETCDCPACQRCFAQDLPAMHRLYIGERQAGLH